MGTPALALGRRLTRFAVLALPAILTLSLCFESAEAQFCVGDCNLDDTVTIDELIVGVNIALGLRGRHDCPPFDNNNDNSVTIDELIQAVRSALDGCPIETATPSSN
ncbi:MAG TPA: hypothetical protein VMT89_18345 [Candidatus Acidoferrales bacterium]|nr:hypothetical protein [Candidatus Acidoferrales bacterium]